VIFRSPARLPENRWGTVRARWQDARMRTDVTLRELDEGLLRALLDAAVADADPREVMPPVAGPDGWTAERRDAFTRFHRSRSLSAEPVETTYAVLVGGAVVGAARLCPLEGAAHTVEAGVWIGWSHRGGGVGGAVLDRLLTLARAGGFAVLYASTTPGNTAGRRILAAAGAPLVREGDTVTARVDLSTAAGPPDGAPPGPRP
jgi:RimJ/RimL family protein N-acetyltransferase